MMPLQWREREAAKRAKRNARVRELARQGLTHMQIARRVGLCRSRVTQILGEARP